jgi:hypothetical protein
MRTLLDDPTRSCADIALLVCESRKNKITQHTLHLVLEGFLFHQSVGDRANDMQNAVLFLRRAAILNLRRAKVYRDLEN